MRQRERNRKLAASLFGDLGRPTRRGIRYCPKCSTKNGTRGSVCKNKNCDVVFRDINGSKRKSTTDACKLSTASLPGLEFQVFSVRIRDRGPDYRNFVQLPMSQGTPGESLTSILTENRELDPTEYVPKCYVDVCTKNKVFPCSHINSAQNCFSTASPILIKNATVANLNIPYESKEMISQMFGKIRPDQLIQRVSKTTFVVRCQVSSRHPLGFLHILFFKPNGKEERSLNSEPKFLCTCRPYKISKNESDSLLNETIPVFEHSTKICIHYYACICAFASHEELELEFEYFVSHAISQQYPHRPQVPALAEIDLTNMSHSEPEVIDVEAMDDNQMSNAEIIRENISLLESIAAADDSSLPNSLENELNDQIIVTSVDDSLNFGDSSALDGLDDPEAQVSGHLTHISEILSQTPNQQVIQIYANSSNMHTYGGPDNDMQDMSDQNDFLNNLPSNVHHRQPLLQPKTVKQSGFKKVSSNQNSKGKTDIMTTNNTPDPELEIMEVDASSSPAQFGHSGFEQWLAGINEMINATMNYQFDGKPEPFVLLASQGHFDVLKDRITAGIRKKRLPNQTVLTYRRDRPPLGKFTKHIWKITNIVQILRIFHSSIVPLKLNQYFIKTADGRYDEWTPARYETPKNTPIIPVLHSTYLKIGKNDLNTKENVPFIIEWTEDVLPQSRFGELSFTFQFNHTGPIHTDEGRRNSVAPIQQLLLNHNIELSNEELSRIGILF